jgi:hypothetical protein
MYQLWYCLDGFFPACQILFVRVSYDLFLDEKSPARETAWLKWAMKSLVHEAISLVVVILCLSFDIVCLCGV